MGVLSFFSLHIEKNKQEQKNCVDRENPTLTKPKTKKKKKKKSSQEQIEISSSMKPRLPSSSPSILPSMDAWFGLVTAFGGE